MIHKMLANNRYLILIAVLGSYLAAALLLIYGGFLFFAIFADVIRHPELNTHTAHLISLACIELIDIFLLGTAFYIVAVGLYELFIDRRIAADSWLHVENLDDLKAKFLGIIIVVLAVSFLEQVINWDGKRNILGLGIAEALIIGVITLAIRFQPRSTNGEKNDATRF